MLMHDCYGPLRECFRLVQFVGETSQVPEEFGCAESSGNRIPCSDFRFSQLARISRRRESVVRDHSAISSDVRKQPTHTRDSLSTQVLIQGDWAAGSEILAGSGIFAGMKKGFCQGGDG